MVKTINSIAGFLDQNLFGFLILLIAAYFYKTGEKEGAIAFFGTGSALMGVRKFGPVPSETTTTKVTSDPPSATVTTGVNNG